MQEMIEKMQASMLQQQSQQQQQQELEDQAAKLKIQPPTPDVSTPNGHATPQAPPQVATW